jgi:protein required for attachment to host cells
MKSGSTDIVQTHHYHSHPDSSQLEAGRFTSVAAFMAMTDRRAHQHAPMLPGPKYEPLPTRGNPRTLETLRQHVHREFTTTVFRFNEHRKSRKQAPQPERWFRDERGK